MDEIFVFVSSWKMGAVRVDQSIFLGKGKLAWLLKTKQQPLAKVAELQQLGNKTQNYS